MFSASSSYLLKTSAQRVVDDLEHTLNERSDCAGKRYKMHPELTPIKMSTLNLLGAVLKVYKFNLGRLKS